MNYNKSKIMFKHLCLSRTIKLGTCKKCNSDFTVELVAMLIKILIKVKDLMQGCILCPLRL